MEQYNLFNILLFIINILVYANNTQTPSSSVTGTSSGSQTSSDSPSMSQTSTNLITETCSISQTYYSPYLNFTYSVSPYETPISQPITENSLNNGEIAGIVIGTTAGILIIGGNIYLLNKYLKQKKKY